MAIPDVSNDFLCTALELTTLRPWLLRSARESDCKVSSCDSNVKRAVTRSDGRVSSVYSFPFVTLSLHSVLLLRASRHEAHLTVGSSCYWDRRLSAAQLIVAVGSENNLASLSFTFISVVWWLVIDSFPDPAVLEICVNLSQVCEGLDCWWTVESEEDSIKLSVLICLKSAEDLVQHSLSPNLATELSQTGVWEQVNSAGKGDVKCRWWLQAVQWGWIKR